MKKVYLLITIDPIYSILENYLHHLRNHLQYHHIFVLVRLNSKRKKKLEEKYLELTNHWHRFTHDGNNDAYAP